MIERILVRIAVFSEKISIKIKKKIKKRKISNFLGQYGLKDEKSVPKKDIRYNPYEGTNLLLIDELIKSNVISQNDAIMDIGSGTGLFLLYLAANGFTKLYGIEMENYLYERCLYNIRQFCKKTKNPICSINIIKGNAVETAINDEITHFYLFNTFYDKDTYLRWLSNVEDSLKRKPRKVKIIILYPTVASMGAMRQCNWLYENGRVLCEAQICYRCVNFIIYENKI